MHTINNTNHAGSMNRLVAWLRAFLPGHDERPDTAPAAPPSVAPSPARRRSALLTYGEAQAPGIAAPDGGDADDYDVDSELGYHLVDAGPGKNVLVRRRVSRPGADSCDGLSIVDDDAAVRPADSGFDPYNTGKFDRSANWSRAARK